MLSWIKKLFADRELETLKKENSELKNKLEEKQEVINRTNAYWKRKFYLIKKGKS